MFVFVLFIAAYLLVNLYRNYAIQKGILAIPNHRSSHKHPIPNGGGLVFSFLWLLVACFYCYYYSDNINLYAVLLPGSLLVLSVGFIDDLHDLPIRYRIIAQFLAAFITIYALGGIIELDLGFVSIHLGWLGSILAAIAIVWSINLYNFMDGLDGLASIEALFVFTLGSGFIWISGGWELAILGYALVSLIIGFLLWNWPPAKIFMGDVGSSFLGFLVLTFALIGEKFYGVPSLIWLILYSLFFFDATVTLMRRFIAKEQWWQAHRLHAFQRLYKAGWSQRKILHAIIAINIILSGLALWAFYHPQALLICLLIDFAFLLALYIQVERIQPLVTGKQKNSAGKILAKQHS